MDLLALGASLSILVTIMAVALAFYASTVVSTQIRGRLEGALTGATSVVEGGAVTPLRESPTVMGAFQFFLSGAWLERMAIGLREADSNLNPTDFLTMRTVFAGLFFAAPILFLGGVMGVLAGLVGAVVGFQAPQMWMNQRKSARAKKLEEQLPEAIMLISNSVKAGFGLLQSLNLAAEQLEHPISTEFSQTIHEMNVGSNTDEALMALSERAQNYDLDLCVTAMLVQRSVGGNLGEILDTVAETMRERIRIRGEITTLTAQQMMTGIVIGLLPVGVGLLFLVVSPEYISILFTTPMGKGMLAVAVVMETIGVMIIRKILDIEV